MYNMAQLIWLHNFGSILYILPLNLKAIISMGLIMLLLKWTSIYFGMCSMFNDYEILFAIVFFTVFIQKEND
jgi:hypothetical protein